MGRKGSMLIPFFKNALFGGKYINLQFEGNTTNIFSLNFPRSSSCLETGCQMILKDWCNLKGRKYTFSEDYKDAKQTLESDLRNSDFLERVQSGRNKKLIYRILESEEVKAKKLSKKASKKKLKEDSSKNTDQAPSSVQSSGYGSGKDFSVHYTSEENHSDHALTHAVKHDECNYALLYALEYGHENLIQTNCIIYPEQMESKYIEIDNLAVGSLVVENEGTLIEQSPFVEREGLIAESEGLIVESEGLIVESEGLIAESEGLIAESGGLIAESGGLIAESGGLIAESGGLIAESGGLIAESGGLIAESGGLTVENEGPLDLNMLPISQMEMGNISFNSENGNAPLADAVGCSNIWNLDESHSENLQNITNGLSGQNSCMQDLNQLFDIDNFLIPSFENYEELLKNASEELDLEKCLAENEISSTIDPPSFKTQKVYKCLYCQQIPGMVLLTFQSKLMEFCGYDSNANDPDSTRFIFDEATLEMISSCILLEKKVLSEDHLLLIFKCIAS